MAMLILEAIGPKGEELALAAGEATDVAVGWDDEFDSATFDSDTHDDEEFETLITQALAGIDPDWQTHLRVID
jgi:hypothetical protein